MYNGVGLASVRGSATNGYVQRNMSFIRKDRVRANQEFRMDEYQPPKPKKANPEILEHERKRAVELKILQFREAMEERNYSEEEIEAKVAEIRKQLTSVAGGASSSNSKKLSSHEEALRQEKKNAAFADALGVKRDQNPGEAFNEELQETRKQERIERQQREWEARQADRESRQRDYEDRQRNREDRDIRGRDRGGGRGGPTTERGLDDDLDAYMKTSKDGRGKRAPDSRSNSPRKRRDDSKRSRSRSRSSSSSSSSDSGSDSDDGRSKKRR
jgi:serine/arginine repetitive matrix protein 2